ncbi:hypothetical protein QJQ45_014023, partial [Haematococcus lacustris]
VSLKAYQRGGHAPGSRIPGNRSLDDDPAASSATEPYIVDSASVSSGRDTPDGVGPSPRTGHLGAVQSRATAAAIIAAKDLRVGELRSELSVALGQQESLRQTVTELQQEADRAQQMTARLAEAEEAVQQLRQEGARREQEHRLTAEEAWSTQQRLAEQLGEALSAVAGLQRELSEAQAGAVSQLSSLADELQQLQAAVEVQGRATQQELAALHQATPQPLGCACVQLATQLQQAVQDHQAALFQTARELSQQQSHAAGLAQQLGAEQAAVAKAQAALQASLGDVREAQQRLALSQDALVFEQRARHEAVEELREAEHRLSSRQGRCESLERESRELQSQCEALQAQLHRLLAAHAPSSGSDSEVESQRSAIPVRAYAGGRRHFSQDLQRQDQQQSGTAEVPSRNAKDQDQGTSLRSLPGAMMARNSKPALPLARRSSYSGKGLGGHAASTGSTESVHRMAVELEAQAQVLGQVKAGMHAELAQTRAGMLSLQERNEDLAAQLSQTEARLSSSERLVVELQRQSAEAAEEWAQQASSLQAAVLQAELAAEAAQQQLQAVAEGREAVLGQVEEWRRQLLDSQQACEELQVQLQDKERLCRSLAAELESAGSAHKLDMENRMRSELQLQEEVARLQVAGPKAVMEEEAQSAVATATELAELREKFRAAQALAADSSRAQATLEQQMGALRQQLEAAASAREACEAQLQEQEVCAEQLRVAQQQLAVAQDEVQQLQQRQGQCQAELAARTEELAACQAELSVSQGAVQLAQSRAGGQREEAVAHEQQLRLKMTELQAQLHAENDSMAAMQSSHAAQLHVLGQQLERQELACGAAHAALLALQQQSDTELGLAKEQEAEMSAQLALLRARCQAQEVQLERQGQGEAKVAETCRQLQADLDSTTALLQAERLKTMQLQAEALAAAEAARAEKFASLEASAATDHANSCSDAALDLTAGQPHESDKVVQLCQENRELLARLETMHAKLRLTRAKLAQAQARLAVTQADASRHQDATSGAVPHATEVAGGNSRQSHDPHHLQLQAYKVALIACQEEIAVTSSLSVMAQSRADLFMEGQEMRMSSRHRHDEASVRSSNADAQLAHSDSERQQLLHQLKGQNKVIEALKEGLNRSQASHEKDCQKLFALTQELMNCQRKLRETEAQAVASAHEAEYFKSHAATAQAALAAAQTAHHAQDAMPLEDMVVCGSPTLSLHRSGAAATAAASARLGQLDSACAAWKDACGLHAQRAQQLEQQLEATDTALHHQQQQLLALQQQVEASRQRASDTAQSCDQLQSQLTATLQQLAKERQQNSAASAQLSAMEEALAASRTAARRQVSELQAQLEAAQGQAKPLGHQLAALQAAIAQQEAGQQAATEQSRRLQAELEEVRTKSIMANRRQQGAPPVPLQARARLVESSSAQEQLSNLTISLRRLLAQHGVRVSGPGSLAFAAPVSPPSSPGGASARRMDAPAASAAGLHQMVTAVAAHLQSLDVKAKGLTDRLEQTTAQLDGCRRQLAATQAQSRDVQDAASQHSTALQVARKEAALLTTRLARKEADSLTVQAEINRQMADYEKLKARLIQQEQDSSRLMASQNAMARKCDELHAAMAAKQDDYAAAIVRTAQLQEQLNASRNALAAAQERLRSQEHQHDDSERQTEAAHHQLHALSAQLREAQQNSAALQEQLDKKSSEIRELHQMLKAWEAMRLGKDAQIAALLERCKRHEEDAAEKARTVDALRRKVAAVGRTMGSVALSTAGQSLGGFSAATHMLAANEAQPADLYRSGAAEFAAESAGPQMRSSQYSAQSRGMALSRRSTAATTSPVSVQSSTAR